MPLDLPGLKTNLTSAYNQAKSSELTETQFADLVATAIDTYVRTALVTVTGVTSGSASAGGTLS